MDGPWQIGHKNAEEYARVATETARAMRMEDPDLELIACGSSNAQMETFAAWENTVLTEAYDVVDMISAHVYYSEKDGDQASFLASADDMDYFIDSVVATADHVRAKLERDKRIMISLTSGRSGYTAPAEPPSSGDDLPVASVLLVGHLLRDGRRGLRQAADLGCCGTATASPPPRSPSWSM